MSNATVADFVSRIAVHFPPPRFESQEQEAEWLRSIVVSLRAYSESVLERAAQRIIDTRGVRRNEKWFPVPAEIRLVCEEIIAEDRRPKLIAEARDVRTFPTRSAGRIEFVVGQLLSGEMGRRAAREGWIGILYDEVMTRNALPHEGEVPGLRRQAQEFHETLEACHRGAAGPKSREWARLGDNLVKRSRIVAGIVLGERGLEDLHKHLADVEASA